MDYWDRYHREVHFWDGDELDLSHLVVPEWLDGIPSYFEGAPEHDVLLQDIPWQYEGQFDAIVAFESRPAPLCVVLFGEAERIWPPKLLLATDRFLANRTHAEQERRTSQMQLTSYLPCVLLGITVYK
jgi:hypothetical protein